MNWNERVLADRSLTTTARQLVDTISRYFANTAAGYATFHDYELGGLIGVSAAQIRAARLELEERNFLRPLRPHGRPRYRLCLGYARAEDDEAA